MRILFFITVIGLFHSCLDKIDLSVPKGLEEGIVIIGELRKSDPSFIKIKVSSIFNFDLETLAPISAKSVFLIDQEGQQLEIPIIGQGINTYTFKGNEALKVEFGKQYKIRVTDKKERIFESTFEELMPPIEKGELSYEFSALPIINDRNQIEDLPAIQFLFDGSIKIKNREEAARILWIPERTYAFSDSLNEPDFISKICYIKAPVKVTKLHLFEGPRFELEALKKYPLSKVQLNYEFAEGYYYTLYQRTLDEQAFEYWEQTQQVIERTGNQFEPPVGRIITNFKNINNKSGGNVLGYFSAFYEDTLRLCVTPKEVGSPLKLCPTPNICPNPCCDCLLEGFSSLEMPEFWEK